MDIINLKLFPSYHQPPTFEMFEVPVPVSELPEMVDSTWEITTHKVDSNLKRANL